MTIRLPQLSLMCASLLAGVVLNAHAADHAAPATEKAATHAAPHGAVHSAPHWSYSGEGAPAKWGNLEPGFSLCKLGKQQSPVDIQIDGTGKPAPIEFSYAPSDAEVVNNGHTVQINLKNAGGFKLDGTEFKLAQFHFHTPSEEKIRGVAYPMVAHLVHKSATGNLAVVAVLFEVGEENQALKEMFAKLPADGHSTHLANAFNASAILPAYKGYYKFMGSLTTPPCSENVQWQILKQRVEISQTQLNAFKKLYKMNARPVQPLNGRKVEES